jgi:hypothetical protein
MANTFQEYLKKNEKIIGFMASVLAMLMFVSLIEVLISNIQEKSDILIQPLATALNGLFWSLYAYGRKDLFLLIPNMLAFVLGTATAISVFI